ncbi:uncharacterized protein LOC142334769 isoform X3 [Convolutriloba macropyga]|uniref:uncharacterized protein LOC142334769 isoform X3 n=1 Tax=Convolutriloba macropyga TaxID=536237 RepID=UPI003F523305
MLIDGGGGGSESLDSSGLELLSDSELDRDHVGWGSNQADEWLLPDALKPRSPVSNRECREWVQKQCEQMEFLQSCKNNLIVAVDIIKQRRDNNFYSNFEKPPKHWNSSSLNSVNGLNSTFHASNANEATTVLNSTTVKNNTSFTVNRESGSRQGSNSNLAESGSRGGSNPNLYGHSLPQPDMTDITVRMKMQEEAVTGDALELRQSLQNHHELSMSMSNGGRLRSFDSQEHLMGGHLENGLDMVPDQASTSTTLGEYYPNMPPNHNVNAHLQLPVDDPSMYDNEFQRPRRRSRTHSRDRGPMTERKWDFVGLGDQQSRSSGTRRRSVSRSSMDSSGGEGRHRPPMGGQITGTATKRKSTKEKLEEASRQRQALRQHLATNRGGAGGRRDSYNVNPEDALVITAGGDFSIGVGGVPPGPNVAPIHTENSGYEMPGSDAIGGGDLGGMRGGAKGARNASYSTDRRNPNAPVIDSSENLFRTSSRDSLPGNRPSVRGRQMNDSFGRVSATGDDVDAMNDSVFNQENSIHIEGGGGSGIVYSSNPGLSARKLSAASSGMGSQERLKSASGHNLNNMNSSFTKPKSAFSNDSLSNFPSKDSLVRRGSLSGAGSTEHRLNLRSSSESGNEDRPSQPATNYHTPRTSRPSERKNPGQIPTAPSTVVKQSHRPMPQTSSMQSLRSTDSLNADCEGVLSTAPSSREKPSPKQSMLNTPPKTVMKNRTRQVTPESRSPSAPGQPSKGPNVPRTVTKGAPPRSKLVTAAQGPPNGASNSTKQTTTARTAKPTSSGIAKPGGPAKQVPPATSSAPSSARANPATGTQGMSATQHRVARSGAGGAATSRMTQSQSSGSLSSQLPSNGQGESAKRSDPSLNQTVGSNVSNRAANGGLRRPATSRVAPGQTNQQPLASGGPSSARSSNLPNPKASSAIPGPRTATRGRRRLPEVPSQSLPTAEETPNMLPPSSSRHSSYNINQSQSAAVNKNASSASSNSVRPYQSADQVSRPAPNRATKYPPPNKQSTPSSSTTHLSASYEVLQGSHLVDQVPENSNSVTAMSSDIDHSTHSPFRLVKPIAKRPGKSQKQPTAQSSVERDARTQREPSYSQNGTMYVNEGIVDTHDVGYGNATELGLESGGGVGLVGDDSILPLKYLIPAQPRDSPSDFMDVYSGDEFVGGDDPGSQWDEGCF